MIAGKHLDPLVGVDVHIVQPPGPVPPVPIPHPYVGILFDPMDYVPVLGATVKINGLPRAVAGTSGQAMPPHIPMGGVFVKPPTSESEVFMGSMTVSADGDPLSRLAMPVLSCQDIGMPAPPRKRKKKKSVSLMLPTTLLMAIPVGPMVMVGGPPIIAMPGPMDALGPLAKGMVKLRKALAKKSKRFARAMRAMSNTAHKKAKKAMDRVGLGDKARNRVHRAICTVTGHPVDVATGKLFTEQVDFELPGPIPFRWERVWYSTSRQRGALGLGWHHAYDLALIETEGAVAVRLADGRVCAFPALADGQSYFDRTEKMTLEKQGQTYRLRGKDGLGWVFSAQPRGGDPFVLTAMHDRSGNQLSFHYVVGRLDHIVDSAGRRIAFLWDDDGRIRSITGPTDTDEHARMTLVAYAYDCEGCLIQAADALGKPTTYAYQNGLLVRETNRNGLSFYFQYDGADEHAHCVRTWGDGGIYDHKIVYDDLIGKTVVVNSLGQQTTYQHRGGLVFKTIDALGAVHLVERDDTNNVVSETDPMGGMTMTAYDVSGNVTSVMNPGGAKTSMTYNEHDQLVSAVDAMGGQWRWTYDEWGRIVARQDPLRRTTQYQWQGRNLGTVVDAAGQATCLSWNERGDLVSLRTPDREDSRWRFDLLGRCTAAIDTQGNEQRREFDRMGRVLKVHEPDGNVRELAYDGEGNVIRARDVQHDVQFAYAGLNRLIARGEGGTMVQFAYDTEEQLVGIRNEHGLVYQFVLGPTGEVDRELGWDGLMRRYQRDKAGRVTKVVRGKDEDARWSAYKHDAAGRVVAVTHADESKEAYAYRPDGLLSVATNGTSAVVFERDVIGRIIKESQGEHSIVSRWDVRDLREGFVSSLGADVRITRNVMGDVMGVEAMGGPQVTGAGKQGAGAESPARAQTPESLFSARFERDRLGLEIERALPGGVQATWQRDRLGRPLRHEISSFNQGRVRDSRYTWGPNDRLQAVVDNLRSGPVHYTHDAVGNLSGAKYEDGRIDLRMPDAVGNLFRVSSRTDRVYGPGGQLLESNDGHTGITRYTYDVEGNLLTKTEPTGGVWRYSWNAAGMLVKVVRPDGGEVGFAYDPLGRRAWKKYRGKTTRWVWDGNVPLHEWVERDNAASADAELDVPASQASAIDAQIARRNAELFVRPAQGPPRTSVVALQNAAISEGTKAAPITWLFEPESFAPLGRLVGKERHSIVTDHLGTPVSMLDTYGRLVWSAEVGAWGQLRHLQGDRAAQPFRWPGQYEDVETGLYYNRFRYYDPDAGQYVSQDPLRSHKGLVLAGYAFTKRLNDVAVLDLHGGSSLYGYVGEPLIELDPLGLIRLLLEDGVNVQAYPGPEVTTNRPEHKPLHIHIQEKGQKMETRVLMEDWRDGGRMKARKGEVIPGDRALTKREKRVVSKYIDSFAVKSDSVYRTGKC